MDIDDAIEIGLKDTGNEALNTLAKAMDKLRRSLEDGTLELYTETDLEDEGLFDLSET